MGHAVPPDCPVPVPPLAMLAPYPEHVAVDVGRENRYPVGVGAVIRYAQRLAIVLRAHYVVFVALAVCRVAQ